MKGSIIRKKIFNAYAINLKHVMDRYQIELGLETDNGPVPIKSLIYICPLCMRGYLIEALDQHYENPLTIEDLPPKSVGGNPKILTCKECNSISVYQDIL